MINNFSLVAGKDNAFVGALPWALLAVVILGTAYAQILRRREPAAYSTLGEGETTSEFDDVVSTDAREEEVPT